MSGLSPTGGGEIHPDGALRAAPGIVIGADEISCSFVRAPGPGGQKVNKTASCAIIRFDAARSPALTPEVRVRLLRLAGARATTSGEIVIRAHRFRSRERNLEDALLRLRDLLAQAARTPKTRRPTRPSRAAREKRLTEKRHAATRKGRRGPVHEE